MVIKQPSNVFLSKLFLTTWIFLFILCFSFSQSLDPLSRSDLLENDFGFVIPGVEENGELGYSVTGGGDINGDGFPDIVLSAPSVRIQNQLIFGKCYVIFGQDEDFPTNFELSSLNGENGFSIVGREGSRRLGHRVRFAGDVNGDSIDDLLIGDPFININGVNNVGQIYVILGTNSGFDSEVYLDSLNGSNGFIITGKAIMDDGYFGFSLDGAGDVNKDGLGDIIVGAYGIGPEPKYYFGESYLIFGQRTFSAELEITEGLEYPVGFSLPGNQLGQKSGYSVSGLGDFNGDGWDDVAIGAPEMDNGTKRSLGESYVVFGGDFESISVVELATMDNNTGLTIMGTHYDFLKEGKSVSSLLGFSIGRGGDINDDGFDDIIMGAPQSSLSAVVFGGNFPNQHTFDLSDLNVSSGFWGENHSPNGRTGEFVQGLGDINGGGQDDMLVGAPLQNANDFFSSGVAYILYGESTTSLSSIDLNDLVGENGFILQGDDNFEKLGHSASNAGDINGDGIDDFLVGVPGKYQTTKGRGEVYVIYGGRINNLTSQNNLPIRRLEIPDQILYTGFSSFRVELSPFFSDQDGDSLRFNATSFDTTVVKVKINGESLIIEEVGQGRAQVYVHAEDGRTGEVDNYFHVFVEPEGLEIGECVEGNGMVIIGEDVSERFGFYTSNGGDINGDGVDDLLVGNSYLGPEYSIVQGRAYVFFGGADRIKDTLRIADLNGTNGFIITGDSVHGSLGGSLAGLGDVNGDGLDDVLISAHESSSNGIPLSGRCYVIFGRKSGFTPIFDLESLDGENGFIIDGRSRSERIGKKVSFAGDINGDGINDILIGADHASITAPLSGEVIVVFGKDSGFPSNFDLQSLNGENGFIIYGKGELDLLGYALHGPGDINGDGLDDLLFGAIGYDSQGMEDNGAVFVLFGSTKTFNSVFDLSSLDGTNGYEIPGVSAGSKIGSSVKGIGDINGDGIKDFALGIVPVNPTGTQTLNSIYVIFGTTSQVDGKFNLSDITGENGFSIRSTEVGDRFGSEISAAGDFNGDGLDDLLLSAFYANANGFVNAGETYLLFGKRERFVESMDFSNISNEDGLIFKGNSWGWGIGFTLEQVGDFNEDGRDDILIGAPHAEIQNLDYIGLSYILFGKDLDEISTSSQPQTLNETLRVYPNPVHSELHIQAAEPIQSEKMSIEIFDLIGRSYKVKSEFESSDTLRINTVNLHSGVYIIIISYQDRKSVVKFVKSE